MKKCILVLMHLIVVVAISYAQSNDEFSCALNRMYVEHAPLIYENKTDTLIKIHYKGFDSMDTYLITKSGFDSYRTDSITTNNPVSNFLGTNDRLIKTDDFEEIGLKEIPLNSDGIVYGKNVDFVGDKSIDKIELKYGDANEDGRRPLVLRLYENKDNRYISSCNDGALLWEKPLELYISNVKHMGMSVIMIKLQSDIPEEADLIEMLSVRKVEKD